MLRRSIGPEPPSRKGFSSTAPSQAQFKEGVGGVMVVAVSIPLEFMNVSMTRASGRAGPRWIAGRLPI
jgi:hypothetical protein